MIITSHTWSTARGKVGGLVYSATPDHPIVARQYVIPVNKQTTMQTYVREAFGAAVYAWNNITAAKRELWRLWVGVDATFGQARRAFIRQYAFAQGLKNKAVLDAPGIYTDPPSLQGDPMIQATAIAYGGTVGTTGVSFNLYNPALLPVSCQIIPSSQQQPARNYWNGPFYSPKTTIEADIPAGDEVTVNITDTSWLEGNVIFCQFRGFKELTTPLIGLLVSAYPMVVRSVLETKEALAKPEAAVKVPRKKIDVELVHA